MESRVDLDEIARRRGAPLRILITRLRYLGDVILTIPAITAAKKRYPAAEIYYLAEEPHVRILEAHPDLAGIIPLRRGALPAIEAVRSMRRLRFAAAVDLFYNPRSAILLSLAGIPIRVGGGRRGRRRLYTHTFAPSAGTPSAIAHHLAALSVIDVAAVESLPRVYLEPDEERDGREAVERAIGAPGPGGRRRVVAIHPGGTWPAKRWPEESFARLAEMIARRLDARVVVIAGPGEEGIARAVARGAGGGASVLSPRPIREAAAAMKACSAVVANDGGILHLSVALGIPTVGVFGPTEPEIWFPYAGRGAYALATLRAECAPCHKHECEGLECLRRLAPEAVFERLEAVLTGRSAT